MKGEEIEERFGATVLPSRHGRRKARRKHQWQNALFRVAGEGAWESNPPAPGAPTPTQF